MNTAKAFESLGETLFLRHTGGDDSGHVRKKAAASALLNHAPARRKILAHLSDMFDACGKEASEANRFIIGLNKLSHTGNKVVEGVHQTVTEDFLRILGEDAGLDKEASQVSRGALLSILGRLGFSTAPGIQRALLLGAAGTGTAAGALYWAGNRGVTQDADEVEAMKERIKVYDRITRDMEESLRGRGLTGNRVEDEKRLKEISGAESVGIYGRA